MQNCIRSVSAITRLPGRAARTPTNSVRYWFGSQLTAKAATSQNTQTMDSGRSERKRLFLLTSPRMMERNETMKTMTCAQLGGPSNEALAAESFEKIAEISKAPAAQMCQQGDVAHLLAS